MDARGVYNGNATDTLTLKVKACQVSGCGSGTVVTLGTTAALTLSAVTNQAWRVDDQAIAYTIGSSGTVDAQGVAQVFSTSAVASSLSLANTGTVTVNTTVDEYISLTATFSTNSGSNAITLRNLKVIQQ